jgi:hypothetical protein
VARQRAATEGRAKAKAEAHARQVKGAPACYAPPAFDDETVLPTRVAAVALRLLSPQINDAIRGTSFVDDEDDPFEGLTPAEIEVRLACRAVRGSSTRDLHALLRAGDGGEGGACWGCV